MSHSQKMVDMFQPYKTMPAFSEFTSFYYVLSNVQRSNRILSNKTKICLLLSYSRFVKSAKDLVPCKINLCTESK